MGPTGSRNERPAGRRCLRTPACRSPGPAVGDVAVGAGSGPAGAEPDGATTRCWRMERRAWRVHAGLHPGPEADGLGPDRAIGLVARHDLDLDRPAEEPLDVAQQAVLVNADERDRIALDAAARPVRPIRWR